MQLVPRMQFGLRMLLMLPACVGSFYIGWAANELRMRAQQERAEAKSRQLWIAMQQEILEKRRVVAATLHDSIDQIEHQQRMRAFDREMRDPINARMFPNGQF